MKRTLTVALLLIASAGLAQQNGSDDDFLNRLYKVHTFPSVAISPDGKRVAWAEKKHGITIASLDGSNRRQLTHGDEEWMAWSPDSHSLAYLAGPAKRRQLFVRKGNQPAVQITRVRGFLAEPRWSPDGRSVGVLLIENAERAAGPLVAMSRDVGVIEERFAEQRIAIVDVATKQLRIVTPPDLYVYHFDWSPDSKQIAAMAAPGSGDNNYWIAQLHVVDVVASTIKPVYKPSLQIANPRWSPDGRSIAFIEGLMSDEGSTGGDLFLVERDGSHLRNLTPEIHASVTSFEWSGSDEITLSEDVAGESALARLHVADGKLESLWRGAEAITERGVIGMSMAKDGRTSAVIRSSFSRAPEVWAGPIGAWKPLTHANASVPVTWGEAKSIHWKSDGFDVQGWLLAPGKVEAGRRYPIVVSIHGGPASASVARWPAEQAALLSTKGYFVFFPNPRGSYGQGETFTRANVKDFGGGDLRDVLTGLDELSKDPRIDTTRAGISGWSYGGYMTMWTVTQTQRFKAAVAGAGIVNWQSYYGENDIDQWMIPYFGASVYDDPVVYAKSSPITFIKDVKTPTLVLVGERDGECPAPQSFEFWHALKALGVETTLVVYADEGHSIQKPEHKRDIARRLVQWFDKHL